MITVSDLTNNVDVQVQVHYCYYDYDYDVRVETCYDSVGGKEIKYMYCENDEIWIEVEND